MKLTRQLMIGAALAILPALAFALPITVENPSATFSGATGGTNVNYNNGTTHSEVHWGEPTSKNPGDQSGLEFDVFHSPLNTDTGTTFSLGTLSHDNWEVKNGTAISGVDLTFSFSITTPGIGALDYTFPLTIDETNNAPPCAETPVPSDNYCPDIITFSSFTSTQSFTIGGIDYTLDLLGFGTSADDIQDSFITQEGKVSSTNLYAVINAKTPPVKVPEPNALLIMALGLLALGGFVQYRRKRNPKA